MKEQYHNIFKVLSRRDNAKNHDGMSEEKEEKEKEQIGGWGWEDELQQQEDEQEHRHTKKRASSLFDEDERSKMSSNMFPTFPSYPIF